VIWLEKHGFYQPMQSTTLMSSAPDTVIYLPKLPHYSEVS